MSKRLKKQEPVLISVLIISHLRPAWLKRCVNSLIDAEATAHVQLQWVIGINGPDPESRLAAQALAEVHLERGARQELFQIELFEETLTPAEARNRLIPRVSSPWVFFIDDDAYIDPSFFRRFAETLAEFPAAAAIGGPNLTPPDSTLFQKVVGLVLSSRWATYCSVARYKPAGVVRRATDADLILCNLFVRSDCLSARSFPVDFKCAEENWLLQTLAESGHEVIYDPQLSVWHERRGELLKLTEQVYKYGFGRGQNIWRRPRTLRLAHLMPSICLLILGSALAAGLAHRAPSVWILPLLAIYALLSAAAALRVSFRPILWVGVFLLFPLIHVSYGWGVLRGFFRSGYDALF